MHVDCQVTAQPLVPPSPMTIAAVATEIHPRYTRVHYEKLYAKVTDSVTSNCTFIFLTFNVHKKDIQAIISL